MRNPASDKRNKNHFRVIKSFDPAKDRSPFIMLIEKKKARHTRKATEKATHRQGHRQEAKAKTDTGYRSAQKAPKKEEESRSYSL
jgi:hypothetical protein